MHLGRTATLSCDKHRADPPSPISTGIGKETLYPVSLTGSQTTAF